MSLPSEPFTIRKGNVYGVPIIHYSMEMAAQVRLAFHEVNPDCVAVELAETMELQLLHAASRLPDISIVIAYDSKQSPLYYLSEPCDAAFEGLRSAIEAGRAAHCIDLDVDAYPDIREQLPDPYAIQRIGLQNYFETYRKIATEQKFEKIALDHNRELHMARRLKELSLSYERVLFVGGMAHIDAIFALLDRTDFPILSHAKRDFVELCTLTEDSCREVMAEFGWVSQHYEHARRLDIFERKETSEASPAFPPDRQKLIYHLYKEAASPYEKNTGNPIAGYHLRNTMKFVRNYALVSGRLMPDLYQMLSAAKSCVDHNYAYETWLLATTYPYLKNVDNLPELSLTIEEVWGRSKIIRFHMREPARKKTQFTRRRKDRQHVRFAPPAPFSICSYQPEDLIIENFGRYLQKKATQIFSEEGARTIPFTTSLEDGIDTRETIRHWHEKKLYVKAFGKPPGGVGSVVVIFDPDKEEDGKAGAERYPWKTTWIGENAQESDMAFYGTDYRKNIIGPGISRCEYGGFMMSYPPRRLWDVWGDPDYEACRSKAELLLMAAIDYALKPITVYVAAEPPRTRLKSFARRFGKKIVYVPIGQLSPVTLNKIRSFHVLDGQDKRKIADEYIF